MPSERLKRDGWSNGIYAAGRVPKLLVFKYKKPTIGGEGGIRTHGTVTRTTAFENKPTIPSYNFGNPVQLSFPLAPSKAPGELSAECSCCGGHNGCRNGFNLVL